MNKTISVCGYIKTGATSVLNFLSEFDDNIVRKKEFQLIRVIDGISDLMYYFKKGYYVHNSIAIHKFKKHLKNIQKNMSGETKAQFCAITDAYFKALITSSWYGATSEIENYFYPYLKRFWLSRKIIGAVKKAHAIIDKTHKTSNGFPYNEMYLVNSNFLPITTEYIENLLKVLGKKDEKNIVLDQFFSSVNPKNEMTFVNNPLAIVVDRDPRDHYLYHVNNYYRSGTRAIPINDVKDYVLYYKYMRREKSNFKSDPLILCINFEDMIYKYQETTCKIVDFLGLKNNNKPKSRFDPENYMQNTQLFRTHSKHKQDILYIEKELPEYLYPFEGSNIEQ